jgi:hypothetical protein
MAKNRPYAALENHPAWMVLDRAIKKLAANGDLDERTAREHIVGYILSELNKTAFLAPQILPPSNKRRAPKSTRSRS